ncbi:hypothetical protein EDB84DRAFT_1443619 [Lactarius hengduanensis]|nr:hypothetical protein EDB84DRAFT_1443619 [Lactarius hengduanensis]
MPDYSSLVRSEASPPASSTLLKGSIRRRSGTHKRSTLSRKASTGSQQTTSYHYWDPQDTETGGPNARTFATAPSPSPNVSHFTAIPARSHRSSLISSHPGPYPRQRERRPTSVTTSTIDCDSSFHSKAHPNSDDDIASSGLPAAPAAEVSSGVSQFSMKVLSFVKQMPFKAHLGLGSLRRKVLKLRFSSYNPSRSPSPKGRLGFPPGSAPKQPFLTAADKLTQKWPRPRSLRSIPSEFRRDFYSSNVLWGPKRAEGWSQGNMEAALRDSQGLGINRVGQWTPHKWCLLASVITVFLLGLTFLVFSILTWFAAYPAAPVVLITDSPALILITFSSSLLLLASLVGVTGTFSTLVRFLRSMHSCSFLRLSLSSRRHSLSMPEQARRGTSGTPAGARTVLQGALGCCGWSNPLHAAVASGTCYPRSPLPGCHGPLVRLEHDVLTSAWGTVFSLVPLHLANILVGLLCANHVTHRFGKGITPPRYRLTVDDILSMGPVDQKKAGLLPSPFPASTSHGAFREDRRITCKDENDDACALTITGDSRSRSCLNGLDPEKGDQDLNAREPKEGSLPIQITPPNYTEQRRQIIPYNTKTAPVCTVGRRVVPARGKDPNRDESSISRRSERIPDCAVSVTSLIMQVPGANCRLFIPKTVIIAIHLLLWRFRVESQRNWRRKIIPHTSKGFYLAPLQHAEQLVIRCSRSIATSHVRPERPLPPPARRPVPRVRGRPPRLSGTARTRASQRPAGQSLIKFPVIIFSRFFKE